MKPHLLYVNSTIYNHLYTQKEIACGPFSWHAPFVIMSFGPFWFVLKRSTYPRQNLQIPYHLLKRIPYNFVLYSNFKFNTNFVFYMHFLFELQTLLSI